MQPKQNPDYVIGYRRPPERTRFQPGRSGNPKGRPKGSRSLISLLEMELDAKIFVTENGQRRAITKREALVKQLVNRSASGDYKMITLLFNLHGDELLKEPPLPPDERPIARLDFKRLSVAELTELQWNPSDEYAATLLERQINEDRIRIEALARYEAESNSSTKSSP